MKTVMDAVIEFRGSIGAVYDRDLCILYHTDVGTYSLATIEEYERLNYFCKSFTMVCPINTFNATVTLLSHAPWIKGASLEEYQAADKEVLKMENKTVEVDGMIYEIGKYYLFSDSSGSSEVYDKLVSVHQDEEYQFVTGLSTPWRRCRAVTGEFGTITPAPAKLINGEAYSFSFKKAKLAGLYFDGLKTFVCLERQVPLSMVEHGSIVHLVPEEK